MTNFFLIDSLNLIKLQLSQKCIELYHFRLNKSVIFSVENVDGFMVYSILKPATSWIFVQKNSSPVVSGKSLF